MVKWIAVAVGIGAGGWYYFVGGRQINESHVQDFYRNASNALYARDPEAMCKLLSTKYVANERVSGMGAAQEATVNRDQACDSARSTFQSFEQLGEQMGGMLTLEYEYQIDNITIAPGRKRARVTGTRLLKMGETVMQFDTRFTEEIEREWGQARLVRSDSTTRVRMAGGRAMSQGDYFK